MRSKLAVYGVFSNGIPYTRIGSGNKTVLLLSGGPGNIAPHGPELSVYTGGLRALRDETTIYVVTRKSGLPVGYTTRQMSDDYAEAIRADLGGHVDVVIGVSFGGMIAQHFAADHADLFDAIVIGMAAHKASEAGIQLDLRYAELLSQGKDRAAGATLAHALYPSGVMRPLATAALWLMGGSLTAGASPTFRQDVLVEAQAEATHDAAESLKRIAVPVLVVCGGADFYFPRAYVEEMAALIPDATLKLYEGKGHAAIADQRFGQDVKEFIEQHRR